MTVRRVLQYIAPFTPFTTGAEALACFAAEPHLQATPVVEHGEVLGMVLRVSLKLKMADKSGYEMFADQPVTMVMDPSPTVVDCEMPLTKLCDEVLRTRPQTFSDGFVITEAGRYVGYGTGVDVLAEIAAANADSNERLKLAMNANRSAIWEIDFTNERLIGSEHLERIYKRKLTFEDVRRLGPDFVVPEEREVVRKALVEIASGAGRGKLRSRIRRDDGTFRELSHAVEVFRDADNHIARMVLMTTDATIASRVGADITRSIDKMEAALEERRAMIDKIINRLALPHISGQAQDEEPELGATYENVGRNRSRLAGMINDVVLRDRALIAAVEAVEAASAAKSRFLANMSHELRTPLNAILGYAEILDEDLAAADMTEQAADAQRIRASARHLLQLINEILDLSKIEAGRMDVSPVEFDAPSLVAEVVATVRPLADKNENELRIDVAADLGTAHTDNVKLHQCLLNLLSNASKFTKGGQVDLRARRERYNGDWSLVFEVADSGIGMSEEQIARLFQPFMQADANTTRDFGGTGLGLAITQRLARLMGGDVEVESRLGEGTRFTLHVPARYAAEQTVAPSLAPASATPAPVMNDIDTERPLVVMIDDDGATRDLVKRSLTRLGFAVTEAATAEEGLNAVRARRPALIILDLKLPDISGWSVLETLKHSAEFEDTPVLVVSVDDDRARALKLGACDLITKPADRDVITSAAVRFARLPRKTQAPASLKIQNVA